jgi:polar amino acid transport system substrate-binding protein
VNKKIALIVVIIAITGLLFWYKAKKRSTIIPPSNTIIVGTNAEYPPFSLMKNDTIVGFDIDLIQEVLRRLDKKIDLKDMPFDALLPAAQVGSIQVIAAGVTATPEREQTLLFTKPYLSGDPLMIITTKDKEGTIATVEDLTGKKVVVNEGFVSDFYMSNIQGPELIRLPTVTEGFLALTTGRADAFVTARNSAQPFFDQQGSENFTVIPIEGTSDNYSLGISKKYPELLEPIQKVLDAMQQDGTVQALKDKWHIK